MLTIVFILSSLSSFPTATAATPLKDIEGHWAQDAIEFLYKNEIVTGLPNGQFGSNQQISRKDAALMITRAMDLPFEEKADEPAPFQDIKTGSYYYGAVVVAVEAGYFTGHPDGSFKPDGQLTRAEMAKVLVEAYELNNEGGRIFADVTEGAWHFEPIQTLVSHRITTGYPDRTFKPGNSISRAEFALLLARAMDDQFRDYSIHQEEIVVEQIDGKYFVNGITLAMSLEEVRSILGPAKEEKRPDADDEWNGNGHDPNVLLADYGAVSITYYAGEVTAIHLNTNAGTSSKEWYKELGNPFVFHGSGPALFYLEGEEHLLAHKKESGLAWLSYADGNFYYELEAYQSRSTLPGNSYGNILHTGIFAKDGEALYYASDYGVIGGPEFAVTQLNDVQATYLNVANGWIYYATDASYGTGPTGIYKMRTDGTDHRMLTNDAAIYLNVVGDWMYYTDDGLYKMKVDGTQKKQLASSAFQVIVHDEWIYYNDVDGFNQATYKMKTDGSVRVKLLDEAGTDLQIVNGWLYYVGEDQKVHRMKLDGTNKEMVVSEEAFRMNVNEKYIYFTKLSQDGLFRTNLDGSKRQMISTDVVDKINLIDEFVLVLRLNEQTGQFEWIENY